VLQRKIRVSLTLRIFLITSLILLAASAMTYGIIVQVTPTSYISIITSDFQKQADELPEKLEQTTVEECGAIIDRFIMDTGAEVMVKGKDGELLDIPSKYTANFGYGSGGIVTTVTMATVDEIVMKEDVRGFTIIKEEGAVVSDDWSGLSYTFSLQGQSEVNSLYVSPQTIKTNQTVQALREVAPLLLGVMLIFSVLCSMFYSRYITRPIVRISDISQHMAGLDFSWKCSEKRQDEIGVLGRNLNDLSEHLSAALRDLQEANEALQQDIDREREVERQRLAFFSAASHELKTPVTILKGQLTGMLEGVDVYQDKDKYLAKALGVTGRMEGLVQEILTVSRMESNGFELKKQPVDLRELVLKHLDLDGELILQKEMELNTSLEPVPVIYADPLLVKKVLDNVLSNAIFYAPDGAKLSVVLKKTAEGVALSVENGGSHIPEESLPRVFEAFYRAEASRNRRTGGSGLGLYIVKMILDRHGAAYGIENTTTGVRFWMKLEVE